MNFGAWKERMILILQENDFDSFRFIHRFIFCSKAVEWKLKKDQGKLVSGAWINHFLGGFFGRGKPGPLDFCSAGGILFIIE